MLDFSKQNLRKAWKQIYISKAPKKRKYSRGIDDISLEDFKQQEEQFIDDLNRHLMSGFFAYASLKYYEIPRDGKPPRKIQAPTINDRIVQKIVNDKAMQGLKDEFLKHGVVGSVKDSTIQKVIRQVIDYQKEGFRYVLKTDIQNYFPSIKLDTLRKIIPKYIKDPELKNFIYKYLLQSTLSGIPQGPPLSPLMANIYLFALDKKYSKRKDVRYIRYVDDILILFKSPSEARKECTPLRKRLLLKGLKIHPLSAKSKTVIGKLNNGKIDVLGVLFDRNELLIKPKKVTQFIDDIVNPLKRIKYLNSIDGRTIAEKLDTLIERLNYQIEGWAGYYSFCNATNIFQKIDRSISGSFSQLLGREKLSFQQKEIYLKKIRKMSDVKIKLKHLELTIEDY